MSKLYRLDDRHLLFHCPGCQKAHLVRLIGPGPVWEWNQSMDAPTFTPSLIYNSHAEQARCHLSIQGGMAEYLADCFHPLARQTLMLPDWPEHFEAARL